MKTRILLWILCMLSIHATAQNADAVLGKWLTGDKNAHIQILRKEILISGRLFG